MPTESAFLLAGLLFVAAALGYVFARFGDTDEDEMAAGKFNADYIKGLNFVLNEESDRAVEVFTRIVALDGDALETHFALGSLFRKRGEVDRAIRVHENLIAHKTLSRAQKDQAEAALEEDFLSAGLLDRAESMFLTLCDSPEFRLQALERLRRIYEITRDWERAIGINRELDKARAKNAETAGSKTYIAHYFCEMAEEAWRHKDGKKAHALLRQAEAGQPRTVRSTLLQAGFNDEAGEPGKAVALYREVIESFPDLLVEVLPHFAASSRAAGLSGELSSCLHKLLEHDNGGVNTAAIAMAAVRDPEIGNPEALKALKRFLVTDRTLSRLIGLGRFDTSGQADRPEIINRVRDALRDIVTSRPGYVCRECGYACLAMQWQCPGCHAWESIRPVVKINLVIGT